MEVWRHPYLMVCGLEDWMNEEIIEEHFDEIFDGAKIESIDILDGGKAKIMFINSQGIL